MPILVAPKPQESLLLYLAAMNQVVSAAVVEQRELEGEAAVAAEPSDDGSPPARPSPGKVESAQMGEVEQKKKMVLHSVSCATIAKHMRSPLSPASRCNESCTTQMQLGGLWSGHWSCRGLASGLKVLQSSRAELWQSS